MNIKKILGYALGPIGSAAFGILSLPLISWYYPAEDIGRIVLLQTISALTMLILGLGLDQAYIREYYAAEDKAALFKSFSLSPFVLSIVGGLLILLWNPSWPSEIIFDLNNAKLGILFLVFLLTTLFTRFFSLILRMQEKAIAFSLSQLTPKFLILVLVLLFILIGIPTHTTSLVFAYTVAQILTVAVLIYQTRTDLAAAIRSPWSAKLHKMGLQYGLPLAFGNLAYWGLTSIDRFVLKQMASLEQLGIYSMAVSFGAVALIFQSVFSTIWAPLVFKWVEDNANLDKIGGITLSMTALISAMVCFIGIFFAGGHLDSSREICIGTVYFTVVHDVSFVLYADGSLRYRLERRQKNLADYRSQYCGIHAELRFAVLAGSALRRTGCRNGKRDFFLGVYAH